MQTPSQSEQEKLIARWQSFFSDSQSAQTELFNAGKRWYDAFYAVYNKNAAPWRSKVIEPKIANLTMNFLAKIALANPEPNLVPEDKHDFVRTKDNEDLLMYQLRNPRFKPGMFFRRFSALCDAAVLGTGFALIPWTNEKIEMKSRRNKDGKVSLEDERIIKKTIGYNDFIPLSTFRFFAEAGANSLYTTDICYLDYKTEKQVKSWANMKDGLDNVRFFNLDKLDENETSDANVEYYEQSRNRLLELQTKKERKRTEIRKCYDWIDKKFYYFANGGKLLIGVEDNVYWHESFPGVAYYMRPRAHSLWGDGFFERNERLGEANNSFINQFFDQLEFSMNGILVEQEDSEIIYQDIRPGGKMRYRGLQKPEWERPPQPDISGFGAARNVLHQAIEEGILSGYETGNPNSLTDKTQGTATGIQAIQGAGSDKISFVETTVAECYKNQYQQWFMNNQQFMDDDIAIRVLGEKGWTSRLITPEDIVMQGSCDIEIDTESMRYQSTEQQAQLTLAYVDRQVALAKFAKESGQLLNINIYELSKKIADALKQSDFDRIITPTPEPNDSPEAENDLLLMGKDVEAMPEEDHKLHIIVHSELLDDSGISDDIKLSVQAHIIQHQQLQQEQVKQQAFQNAVTPQTLQEKVNQANVQVPPGTQVPIQNGQPPVQAGIPGQMAAAAQPGA